MSNIRYKFMTTTDIKNDSKKLAQKLRPYIFPETTLIIAVARGGLIPAQYVAYELGIRNMHLVSARSYDDEERLGKIKLKGMMNIDYSKVDTVIIIDDIYDSGRTMDSILYYLETTYENFCDHDIIFIGGVLYSQKKIKNLKKCGIMCAKKIKKIDGIRPWVVFPWDNKS